MATNKHPKEKGMIGNAVDYVTSSTIDHTIMTTPNYTILYHPRHAIIYTFCNRGNYDFISICIACSEQTIKIIVNYVIF